MFPAFQSGAGFPALYGGYLFAADILAVWCWSGWPTPSTGGYGPTPLPHQGPDAHLIILFTCVIIVTFHFINAFQTLLHMGQAPMTTGPYFPYRGMASIFGLETLSPSQVFRDMKSATGSI